MNQGEAGMWIPDGRPYFQVVAGDEIPLREVWDENVYRLGRLDLEGAAVLDLGAHCGAFALYAAWHRARTVFALEPDQTNWRRLFTNVEANHAGDQITVARGAAHPRSGRSVEVHPAGASTWTSGDLEGEPFDPDGPDLAVTYDLSALVELAGGHVDVLKVDIEGAEYGLFAGDNLNGVDGLPILRRVDIITMEWHGPAEAPHIGLAGGEIGPLIHTLLDTHHVEVFGRPNAGGMLHARRY